MKRIRAVDVPKFRRPIKSSRRIGESVYLNPGGFVYMKLLLMWVSCILLDLLIGFRIELLWPLWLMIRHLYDAFRVQNFVSSFHYSAFSVFFVCVTTTSDLMCFLFVPVQVLVFIASTYVWIQFVYQSTERGFCVPSFLLWGLFVGFEYAVRSRFDQSTLYLTRSSWITAGMFSSTGTDNIFVGNSQESLSRLEIYKPFAAHCLGYPIVSFGFRVKSYFSSWRLKRRKQEVMKQNEFYYRLLADALPAPYDPRHTISSKQLALENADFEIDDENISENGIVITNQPTICSNGTTNTNGIFTSSSSTVNNRKSRVTGLKVVSSSKSQHNGYAANGAVCTTSTKRSGRATANNTPKKEEENTSPIRRPYSLVRLPIYCFWLSQSLYRSAYEFILSPFWRFISTNAWIMLKSTRLVSNSDEILSVSGDGSLLADEESDDNLIGNKAVNDTSKRRAKRARGRTPAVAGEIMTSHTSSHQQIKPQATIAPSFTSKLPSTDGQISSFSHIHPSSLQLNGQLHEAEKSDLINGRIKDKSKLHEKCKCSIKIDELENKLKAERANWRQQMTNMEHEKQILEQALDNLRAEMHQIRSNETAVRAELTIVQTQERSQRAEMNQLRTKLNDAEQRTTQATRQLDRMKKEFASTQIKRDPVRAKKDEIGNRSGTPDQLQQQMSKEMNELRSRFQIVEKELQSTQIELKAKQQACLKAEQRLKNMEAVSRAKDSSSIENEIKNYQQQIADLQQANARLEKTMMSENRLKIDLFRALTESKAQVELMTSQMKQLESGRERNVVEPSTNTNNQPIPSSLAASLNGFGSNRSSPTDRVSPSSSSTHSMVASNNMMNKSSTSITEELEDILQNNGQFGYFGNDSFSSIATPSTNATAQALAQQLKMSASPLGNSASYSSQKPQQAASSRSTSPSTNELFSIINAKSITSSFGSYGLNNPSTTSAPPTSTIGSHLSEGISPTFP